MLGDDDDEHGGRGTMIYLNPLYRYRRQRSVVVASPCEEEEEEEEEECLRDHSSGIHRQQ